ncbi:MAG: hypothetical protein K2Q24_03790 [Chitinophagaceae bacterium]|jgi:hypothetical protein|nr:hypothetical protein [Chitinophagaceae bacterium]
MKDLLLLLILFSIYFTACTDKNLTTEDIYQEKIIVLRGLDSNTIQKDTLGLLTIKIPNKLDTFYQWWNTSDCIPCGWMQYRFADSKYKAIAESGFFSDKEPDSLYQLTIRHKPKRWIEMGKILRPIDESDSAIINDALDRSSLREPELLKKEKIIINDYPFYTYYLKSSENSITNTPSIYVIGVTSLKDRYLQIIAEHSGNDTTGFYETMYKCLLSVRIKEKL